MGKSEKRDTLRETTVEELLDALLDPSSEVETRPAEDPWSEDYQAKLMKKEARKTIDRYRKDPPPDAPSEVREKPVRSEKMQKVKACQDCYYCSAIRKVGGSWWCHCTNPGRSGQVESSGHNWVKGRIGLPCWRGS